MKGENIATRLLVFGAGVVRLCRRLPDDASAKHIERQLVRAATGGGANYEEARGAESRADYTIPDRIVGLGSAAVHASVPPGSEEAAPRLAPTARLGFRRTWPPLAA